MIYVILCPAFKVGNYDEFEKLLKIGYTNDDVKEGRYYSYKSHNPTIKVLYEVPGGDKEIEGILHDYFSSYRYSGFGKEWFNWNEEIINFFDTNKTIDDILRVIDLSMRKGGIRARFSGYNKYIYEIIDNCINYKMKKLDIDYTVNDMIKDRDTCYELILNSRLIIKSGIRKTILEFFNIDIDEYEIFINRELPEKIKSFTESLKSCSNIYEKLKTLCESDLSEEDRLMVLDQLPFNFKKVYLQVGPERLRANSYNVTFIKKELIANETNSNIDLRPEIIKAFEIGKRYSLFSIKSTIGGIYNSTGYMATPKASDLCNYFEVKSVKFFDKELNKTVHGYEILKKKD